MSLLNSKRDTASNRPVAAFSLIEVILATAVLSLGITSTIISLQMGISIYESSRTSDFVVQILEDEAERIRLLNWSELGNLPKLEEFSAPEQFNYGSLDTDRIKFHREVRSYNDNDEIKSIFIRAEWNSMKGMFKEKMLHMLYSKNGLYDYYYGST